MVGVDASEASARAAGVAIALAGEAAAEIVFCHAVDIPRIVTRVDRYDDDYELALDAARHEGRRVLERYTNQAVRAGLAVRARLCLGRPAAEVVGVACSVGADVVVVGQRHSHRWVRLLFGSVRDDIERLSSIPVLVVP